jgi:hypothetical protein
VAPELAIADFHAWGDVMKAVETSDLSKLYAPGVGLNRLNLSVEAGEVFG